MSVSKYEKSTIKKLGLWAPYSSTNLHYERDAVLNAAYVEKFEWPMLLAGSGLVDGMQLGGAH